MKHGHKVVRQDILPEHAKFIDNRIDCLLFSIVEWHAEDVMKTVMRSCYLQGAMDSMQLFNGCNTEFVGGDGI